MYKNNIITVVIPAYNEEEGLKATKLLLPDFIDNIVVINNNSTDDTFNVAKGIGAIVINENNKGCPRESSGGKFLGNNPNPLSCKYKPARE